MFSIQTLQQLKFSVSMHFQCTLVEFNAIGLLCIMNDVLY